MLSVEEIITANEAGELHFPSSPEPEMRGSLADLEWIARHADLTDADRAFLNRARAALR
jgi:hypothetical protein